jgi:iron complex outermembrane receptor protein
MFLHRSFMERRTALRAGVASIALLTAFSAVPAIAKNDAAESEVSIDLEELVVTGQAEAAETVDPDEVAGPPARDLGELLSRLRGISAGRQGGHGSDISIRGMSEDRIAVVSDGAYVFGACPNRMDPPSSSMMLLSGDSITLRRGYQTVIDGPPAPGGTISIDRADPETFRDGISGNAEAGVESNGFQRYGLAQGRLSVGGGYAQAFATARRADNYEDGKGREVRSAFEQFGGGGEVGWRFGAGSVMALSAERNVVEDALFAGAGMDAPWTATNTYRMSFDHNVEGDAALERIEANIYGSYVDHVMDNYSLRVPAMMTMLTEAESDTVGGRLAGIFGIDEVELTLGGDYRRNERDAVSYSSMLLAVPPTAISNYTWPGMEIENIGIFAEAKAPLAIGTELTAGIRTDFVSVKATKADLLPAGMGAVTARQLYAATYGTADTDRNETNVSGLLRVTHDFGAFSGWVGASRAVRTADATERGIARGPLNANAWVGNPGLDPEKHHQVDMGIETERSAWKASASIWYDNVSDFITRDRARGQSGVLVANGANIYRNVDAELAGVDMAAEWAFAPAWRIGGNLAYTWGENTTDDRSLYQIPPLSGSVEIVRQVTQWSAGMRMRWAAQQTQVDLDPATGSGLDAQETPGYAAFDIFGSWKLAEAIELRAGVANVFDTSYASHLNRANGFDPTVVQVNEPGRSAYLQMNFEF